MRAGQIVLDQKGNLGIVTTEARKAGVWKGKVGVMWAGANCSVIQNPADLVVARYSAANGTIHKED